VDEPQTEKNANDNRFDLGGGGLPSMPNLSGAGKRILQLGYWWQ